MIILNKDILTVDKGIIAHQVNCQKVAGKGLALSIAKKFKGWKEDFVKTKPELGKVGFFEVNKELVIANLYAQEFYGYGKRFTDYEALEKCLKILDEIDEDVYLPYGLGCGLAGGDWKIVEQTIELNLKKAIICKV